MRKSTQILALILVSMLAACTSKNKTSEPNLYNVQHLKVYAEEGRFAAWPANHGIWQWGDEILFGFVEAKYNQDNRGLHTYDQNTARNKYARSFDAGLTWEITDAYEAGQKEWGYDHDIPENQAVEQTVMKEGVKDFTDPNFILTFLRENNADGPSHFYYSEDKGVSWEGAFTFPTLGTSGVATRTDYIVFGKQELGAFITVGKENHDEGRVAYVKTYDGGANWEFLSYIGPEPGGFDIMSSSVQLANGTLYTTIRGRTADKLDLIKAFISEDEGKTWKRMPNPVNDTGRGGSPPALVLMEDGRLALGYIYRSERGSRVNIRLSSDNGKTWTDEIMLRGGDGASRDVGYPRMVQRPDGSLLMLYYWNHSILTPDFPYRYIAGTIFDPENLK